MNESTTATVENTVNHRKELLILLQKLAQRHGIWQVFSDFLAVSAYAISNALDKQHFEEREAQYMATIERYTKDELDVFPEAFAHLVLELEKYSESPRDVLGEIFHELKLHNERKGQFFTPQNISNFISAMTFDGSKEIIEERGYISASDPCCGAGSIILGLVGAMLKNGYNPSQHVFIVAEDVDITCVHMCYIQLSLYGIPATVIHGNSLTMEVWSHWYTPIYVVGGWAWRRQHAVISEKIIPESEGGMTDDAAVAEKSSMILRYARVATDNSL